MNKKPGLLFAISLLAMIILAVYFNMDFGKNAPLALPAGVNPDNVLYVCPTASQTFDQISSALKGLSRYVYIMFWFAGIVLFFSWAWAFYQNLLKDKFSADAYKNPWQLTKIIFWMMIVFFLLLVTPNHFRNVKVRGHSENYVLCENTSIGAKAVRPNGVTLP